jgi:hypothetical protein
MAAGLPDLLQSIPDRETPGATRMHRYPSPLNIPLSFRPETATPSPSSMHLYQMGEAGVEGLQLLPLTHATVHPLRAIEDVLTYYLQLCVLQLLPPTYPCVPLGTFRGSATDEYSMNQIFLSVRKEVQPNIPVNQE